MTAIWHTLDICLTVCKRFWPVSDFKLTIVWYLQPRSSQAKVLKWEKSQLKSSLTFTRLEPYIYMNFHFYRGWVSITGNTWRFNTSSFNPYTVHIRLPPDTRSNSWNICCGWINHLQCRFTQCGLYQMPQTQYWNSGLRSWIYIKCWFWWHTVCHIMVPQKASNILPFIVGYITLE